MPDSCLLGDSYNRADLPYAWSQCGAGDVFPVNIEIPELLVHLCTRVVDEHRGGIPSGEQIAMKSAARMFSAHRGWEKARRAPSSAAACLRRRTPSDAYPGRCRLGATPAPHPPPTESFKSW